MNAQDFAANLRAAADWWEAHPELSAPDDATMNVWVTTREEFVTIARSVGHAEKNTQGSIYWLRAKMGATPLAVDFAIARSEVCERRVIGVKVVPRAVTEEHEEEVVEWDCGSIFADGEQAQKKVEGAA